VWLALPPAVCLWSSAGVQMQTSATPFRLDRLDPRLSGSAFTAAGSRCRRSLTQPELPVAGRVPATHVFEEGCVDRREGVDDRDEPGQGDLELFRGLSKQPFSFNRTAWHGPGMDDEGLLRLRHLNASEH